MIQHLSEFDRQKAIQEKSIADQAIASGAFGGGREGVQRAEFASQSGRDRAALQAQLLQQGFGQAQQARQQDITKQIWFRASTIWISWTTIRIRFNSNLD